MKKLIFIATLLLIVSITASSQAKQIEGTVSQYAEIPFMAKDSDIIWKECSIPIIINLITGQRKIIINELQIIDITSFNRTEIYNGIEGDCLELMKFIPDASIDLILADLPYGTTNCKWDSIIDLEKLWVNKQLKKF